MTTETRKLVFVALLASALSLSAVRQAESRVLQPPEHAANPQDPKQHKDKDEKEHKDDEEKLKKKKQQEQQDLQRQEERQRQQQAAEEQKQKQQPQQQQVQTQDQQDWRRQVELQKQQDRELQQKREQQERQLKQQRVSQEELQERVRMQEQQLALYRRNLALRAELAERDEQILRQQNRIHHLRLQQQYEERLRAQRAQAMQARYNYYNDPYYYTAPNYRYVREGRYYQTNQYGIRMLEKALQAGYNEGFRAGRADREDRWRYDYRSAYAYRDASMGYDGRYVGQDEYNYYFREGFQRGYEDGYYGRQKYGRKNDDNGGINDEWLIAGAVIAAIIGYQVLTD
jgi:DNA repair exonuclease SbcCD ATPase subunit